MAIVEIIERTDGIGGGWDLQAGRTYTVSLYVHSDTRITGPKLVMESLGLNVGDTYRFPLTKTAVETDSRMFLNSIQLGSVSPIAGNKLRTEVTVTYRPSDPSKDQQGPVQPDGTRDPFSAPPTLRAFGEPTMVAPRYDSASGEPILNKAGDPFDPASVQVPRSTLTIEVGRTERFFDLTRIEDYEGHVNETEWLGWPARSVLCQGILPSRTWNQDVQGWVWDVTYRFAFKREIVVDDGGDDLVIFPGWAIEVQNAGLRQLVGGKQRNILDATGAPVSTPTLLKSDGTVAGPTDDPIYLTYEVYPTAEFGDLEFPADLFSAGTPETP